MTDLHDALSELPEGYAPPPDDPEERTRWAITNYPPDARDKIASWAMRRLAAIQAEKDRITTAALAEVERVKLWESNSLRPLDADEGFFKGALGEYLRSIRAERGEDPDQPKTTTYKLPTGTITGRRPPERIEVLDPDAFIAWAETGGHPELVRVRKEVAKDAIKRLKVANDGVSIILDTGERAPFVEAKRGPEKLDAKPNVV